jgi:hypothetical protein
MTPTEKMEMQVAEEQDGSAIAQLPEEDLPVEELSDGGEVEKQLNNDSEDDDKDPDREAIRAARREERRLKKGIHREKAKESNHLINALKKQNQQMAEQLARLETRTSGAELARVDKAIDDTAVQVEYAKMKMREAVTQQDGDAVVRAQELMYESQRKLESLKSIKDQATRQMSQPQKQAVTVPDMRVQKNAADWMERNPWYDPQGKDLDSEIAQRLDKQLTGEGYDPSSEDYWDELDDRVSKYLPHRIESTANKKKEKQKVKSIQTSSGRESSSSGGGSNNGFRISPERVAVMKEAGVWDNPEARAKAIKNYVKWDRENKRG